MKHRSLFSETQLDDSLQPWIHLSLSGHWKEKLTG